MGDLDELLAGLSDGSPALRQFTLYLDFLAVDEVEARNQARLYAEALNQLRPEVGCYTARVSVEGNWPGAMAVFCGAPGPDVLDVCVESAGHRELHQGPGGSGRWNDDDVPRAPDNAEGLG